MVEVFLTSVLTSCIVGLWLISRSQPGQGVPLTGARVLAQYTSLAYLIALLVVDWRFGALATVIMTATLRPHDEQEPS